MKNENSKNYKGEVLMMATLRFFEFSVKVYTNKDNFEEAREQAIKQLNNIEIIEELR